MNKTHAVKKNKIKNSCPRPTVLDFDEPKVYLDSFVFWILIFCRKMQRAMLRVVTWTNCAPKTIKNLNATT